MGGGFYLSSVRDTRSKDLGYHTKSRDEIFTQNKERKIHQAMLPSQAILREARDSDDHPESTPIIVGLDLTGSMGHIPHDLIKDGLPTLMGGIIEQGLTDAQLLFLGIGDHETDRAPLQVGQFEASDELIDGWLTKTYIEEGGGANEGESYLLAWYFAAKHTETDAWDKRGKKGFIFTIGDEPSLTSLPSSSVNEIMESGTQESYTDSELLEMAQEKYHVFHIHLGDEYGYRGAYQYWQNLLGENCIRLDRHGADVATAIKDKILEVTSREDEVIDDISEGGPVINLGL